MIERSQVVAREDASSFRITSLILALRTALEFQAFRIEEPLLASLIAGTVQCPSQVSVSTTRIPDFKGDGYKGESSGYQFLGHLSEVNLDVVENCTQHTKVYSFGEVISAALTPRSAEFFSNNRPLDIIPESHFILIFTFRKGSLHPQGSGGSDIYHTFSSTHASDLELPLSDFSDLEIPSSDFSAYPFHNSDTDFTSRLSEWAHSQSACPVSNPDTGGDLGGPVLHAPSRAVSVTSPRTGPYPSRSRSGSVSTEQKIILLLSQSTHLPPTTPDTILRDAKFVRRNSTLSAMIRNHRAMGILLKLCGPDSSQTLTFEDPSAQTRSLTYESVMKACGWSDKTFSNKESHYRNSEKAAGMAWTGDGPFVSYIQLVITYRMNSSSKPCSIQCLAGRSLPVVADWPHSQWSGS